MPDSAYALYLQSPERLAVLSDALLIARWGALARTLETTSCLSIEVDALAETARRQAFIGGPLGEDLATVIGAYDVAALRGRCISLDGVIVFVLGGDVDHSTGVSHLNILRRL